MPATWPSWWPSTAWTEEDAAETAEDLALNLACRAFRVDR